MKGGLLPALTGRLLTLTLNVRNGPFLEVTPGRSKRPQRFLILRI
jgi:hypothetical protein